MEDEYFLDNLFASQPRMIGVLEFSNNGCNDNDERADLFNMQPMEPDIDALASHPRLVSTNLNHLVESASLSGTANVTRHTHCSSDWDRKKKTVALITVAVGTALHGVAQYVSLHRERRFIDRGGVDAEILADNYRLFRLTRLNCRSFKYALQILKPYLRVHSRGHPDELVLLTGLSHLAAGHRLLDTAEILKVGEATALKHTKTVVAAILKARCHDTPFKICFPVNLAATASKFREVLMKYGAVLVPDIVGAIDCTHVAIKASSMQHNQVYYTVTKRKYTISCQAVCDRDLVFYDVVAGLPGRMNDARIFSESKVIDRVPEGYRLLGDGAYSCSAKLLSPYRDTNDFSTSNRKWNMIVSGGRVSIERAFGATKNRWRVLIYNEITDLRFLNRLVYSCFCLHNFCIRLSLPEPGVDGSPLPVGAPTVMDDIDDSELPAEIDVATSREWRDYYKALMI